MSSRRLMMGKGRKPGGALWTPASVSTDIWYDADNAGSITQVGGAVSQWNDQSGNGRHAFQATGIYKFAYTTNVQNSKPGLLSIRDDGSGNSSFMQIPAFSRSQPFMTFFAVKTTTLNLGNYTLLFDGNAAIASGNRPMVWADIEDGGTHQAIQTTPTEICRGGASAVANNTPYYFTGVFDGASSKVRVNGAQVSSMTNSITSTVFLSTSSMLGTWVGGSQGFPGYFLEAFLIPGNSTTDITNAEAYLATKWSIP